MLIFLTFKILLKLDGSINVLGSIFQNTNNNVLKIKLSFVHLELTNKNKLYIFVEKFINLF